MGLVGVPREGEGEGNIVAVGVAVIVDDGAVLGLGLLFRA